jgi:hypothetical protein
MKKINKFLVLFFFFSLSFYGQNDTISVIKHTDKDIIVNKESKIVYRGIPNSLSIEVPNSKSFTATADGLTMISKNLYNLYPKSGSEVIITVNIVLKNDKKKTEKHVFEIKGVSGFATTINGRNGFVRMQKKQFLDANIKVRFEDKNLFFSNNVTAFILKIPGMPSIQVIGNKIDSKTYEKILKNATKGDQITISDVKFLVLEESMKGGMCFKTTPIVIEIY